MPEVLSTFVAIPPQPGPPPAATSAAPGSAASPPAADRSSCPAAGSGHPGRPSRPTAAPHQLNAVGYSPVSYHAPASRDWHERGCPLADVTGYQQPIRCRFRVQALDDLPVFPIGDMQIADGEQLRISRASGTRPIITRRKTHSQRPRCGPSGRVGQRPETRFAAQLNYGTRTEVSCTLSRRWLAPYTEQAAPAGFPESASSRVIALCVPLDMIRCNAPAMVW